MSLSSQETNTSLKIPFTAHPFFSPLLTTGNRKIKKCDLPKEAGKCSHSKHQCVWFWRDQGAGKRWGTVVFTEDGQQTQVLVSQTTFSLLHQLNLEGGFSRCWPSNQQAFPNICAINHTEEYSPHIPLAAVLKVVFVRLNLPSESTLSHSLEKPLPPLTTQGTYRDKTEHTPFSSNSDCQILGGE